MGKHTQAGFPTSAGILFGLGLGGFFDGIVLHQILQWHHMLTSAGVPADTVAGLELNTFWDGLFHPESVEKEATSEQRVEARAGIEPT